MAASIALNPSTHTDATADSTISGSAKPKTGLLNRIIQAGQNLRNAKREDLAWMAGNVLVGVGASKLGVWAAGLTASGAIGTAVSGLASAAVVSGGAALGLTVSATVAATAASLSSIIVVGAASAVAGGLVSGTVRALLGHGRERFNIVHEKPRSFSEILKQESKALFQIKDFKKNVLQSTKSALKPALLGAGLAGVFSGASAFLEHTEIGREIAHSAKEIFQDVAQKQVGYWSDVAKTFRSKFSFTSAYANVAPNVPAPMVAASAPTTDFPLELTTDAGEEIVPDAAPKLQAAAPETQVPHTPAPTVAKPVHAPLQADVPTPASDTASLTKATNGPNANIDSSTRDAVAKWQNEKHGVPVAVPDVAPADVPSVETPSVAPTADAAADVPVDTPADIPTAVPSAPAAPEVQKLAPVSTASPKELAEQAISKAKLAVTQEELTNHFTRERLQEMVKGTTGLDAPADATIESLAKQVQPTNPDMLLRGIQSQAPQIKVENLASACTVELPKEKSSVNVIKTLCYKFKEHMGGSDLSIVDNGEEGGLRILYRRAVKAISGIVSTESTQDFISANISGSNGVIQEMAEAKLGL